MDIDSARLSQYGAASLPVLRERDAEQPADKADLVEQAVQQSDLEFGHDANRSSRGAKALLLDVLA